MRTCCALACLAIVQTGAVVAAGRPAGSVTQAQPAADPVPEAIVLLNRIERDLGVSGNLTDEDRSEIEALRTLRRLEALERRLKASEDLTAEVQDRIDTVRALLLPEGRDLLWRTEQDPPPNPVSPDTNILNVFMNVTEPPADPPASGTTLSVLDFNVGATDTGALTFSGHGRLFVHLGAGHALQAEGAYDYFRDRREAQIDVGLVNRYRDVQLGLFTSIRFVSLRATQDDGTLVQVAATVDWLFPRQGAKVGFFGVAALRDLVVVDRLSWHPSFVDETFLDVLDQVGISGQLGLGGNAYVEGSVAYLNGVNDRHTTGGAVRFVYPVHPSWALTAEGAWNEALLPEGTGGRFLVGFQLGSWRRPQALAAMRTTAPVPVDIPRVRYEIAVKAARWPPPKIVTFEAIPNVIEPANWVTLRWVVEGAAHVTIDNGIGVVEPMGQTVVDLFRTTTFRLTAENVHGDRVSREVVVQVTDP